MATTRSITSPRKYFFVEETEESIADTAEALEGIETVFHEDMYQFAKEHDLHLPL